MTLRRPIWAWWWFCEKRKPNSVGGNSLGLYTRLVMILGVDVSRWDVATILCRCTRLGLMCTSVITAPQCPASMSLGDDTGVSFWWKPSSVGYVLCGGAYLGVSVLWCFMHLLRTCIKSGDLSKRGSPLLWGDFGWSVRSRMNSPRPMWERWVKSGSRVTCRDGYLIQSTFGP